MNFVKKGAAFFLCAVMLTSIFTISVNAANETDNNTGATTDEYVTGDFDGDGRVTVLDVLSLQKHLAKVHMLTPEQIINANFSPDSKVTVKDVTRMQRQIAAVDMAPSETPEDTKPENPVTGVKLNTLAASIYSGNTVKLNAAVTPADADNTNVEFNSSNEKVATVDENGLVKGITAGKATITVTTADGGKTAKSDITVMQKSTLSFSGFKTMSGNKIAVDKAHTLTGTVKSNYPITAVCVRIAGTNMTKTVKFAESKKVKSYDINPAFDNLMNFSGAGVGKHTLEVLATDTVNTKFKKVYSYDYTVTANTSSSALKAYTYQGKTYLVPKGYSSSYLYDQRDYSKFWQGGTNVGCSATAEAIGASILYSKKITPTDSKIIWTGAGAGWGLASDRYYNRSVDSKLSIAYNELIKGKPTLINTLSSSDHWITIIGIAASAQKGDLSSSDFLIANPWNGTIETMKSYLSSTGRYIPYDYSLRSY